MHGNDLGVGGRTTLSGGGDDEFALGAGVNFVGPFGLRTGSGNDTTSLVLCRFFTPVDIALGPGSDTLRHELCDFDGGARLDGGGGDVDTLEDLGGNTIADPLLIRGFEALITP